MAFHGYKKWFCTVKSLKSVTWKAHNSFSIIQVMGLNDEKSWNKDNIRLLAKCKNSENEDTLYSSIEIIIVLFIQSY